MALVSELCDAYKKWPILVIGGGYSAKTDLERISPNYPRCVISANGHGFKQDKFHVNFIVGVDYMFNGGPQPMREYVKQFDAPTINRWSWADYRLPEWNFNGDSGFTAIAVAVLLGGDPVIGVGFDRGSGPTRYFWETEPDALWQSRRHGQINVNAQSNLIALKRFCEPHNVRFLSGSMMSEFPPEQNNKPFRDCSEPQTTLTGHWYSVRERIFLHPTDPVDSGPILLTEREAHPHLRTGKISRIMSQSD